MPKNTFLKLKPEKRAYFTEKALFAFATQDFESVSITRLMQELALPKGSFYQYFEDKRDLYFYLFDYLQQKKDVALAAQEIRQKDSFLDFWEEWYWTELQYYWQNPIEWNFWLNAYRERNSPTLGNLQMLIFQRIAQQFIASLRQESRQGKLKQEASLEMQAYFLAHTQDALTQYILNKYDLNLPKMLIEAQNLPALPAIEIKLTIRQWIGILKFGIVHENS
jgi:AcrR family transcriptional regulator